MKEALKLNHASFGFKSSVYRYMLYEYFSTGFYYEKTKHIKMNPKFYNRIFFLYQEKKKDADSFHIINFFKKIYIATRRIIFQSPSLSFSFQHAYPIVCI